MFPGGWHARDRSCGRHYLFTSGTPGYFPNPSEVAWAPSYHGPWAVLGNPHRDDPSGTSHHSQICSVFKHPHRQGLYIALADRWLPNLPPDLPDTQEVFFQMFSEGVPMEAFNIPPTVRDPDTSIADYVWLPLRFEGEMVYLDWHDEWRIEDYD